jgi:hypothetical protein
LTICIVFFSGWVRQTLEKQTRETPKTRHPRFENYFILSLYTIWYSSKIRGNHFPLNCCFVV